MASASWRPHQGNGAEKGKDSFPTLSAKPWKDTQWRTHMPSEHSLRLSIHTPGRPSQRAASTPNAAAERMTISSRCGRNRAAVRALADAEHGIGYELARKMAGDVAAAICLDDFDAACLQFRPVEEQVLLAAVTSEGDHGRVLHPEITYLLRLAVRAHGIRAERSAASL